METSSSGGDAAEDAPLLGSDVLRPWAAPRTSLKSRFTFLLAVTWLTIAGFGPPWALFSVFEKVGLYYLEATVPIVESRAYYYVAFSVAVAVALGRTAIILNITFARERIAALPDADKRLAPLRSYWWCTPYGLATSCIFVFGDGVGRIWAQLSMWDALGALYFASPDGLFALSWFFATSLSVALLSGVFRVSWWVWYWGAFSKLNGPAPLKHVAPSHPLVGGGASTSVVDADADVGAVRQHRPVRTPSSADLILLSANDDDDGGDGDGDGDGGGNGKGNGAALLSSAHTRGVNASTGSLPSVVQLPTESPLSPDAPWGAAPSAPPPPPPVLSAGTAAAAAATSAVPWYKRVLARVRRTARAVYPAVVAVVPMPVHRGVQYLFRYMDGFGRTWAMFAVFNQFALASDWPDGDGLFTVEIYTWISISVAFLGGCYVVFKGTYRRFKVFLH